MNEQIRKNRFRSPGYHHIQPIFTLFQKNQTSAKLWARDYRNIDTISTKWCSSTVLLLLDLDLTLSWLSKLCNMLRLNIHLLASQGVLGEILVATLLANFHSRPAPVSHLTCVRCRMMMYSSNFSTKCLIKWELSRLFVLTERRSDKCTWDW